MNIKFLESEESKEAAGIPGHFPYPVAIIGGERALETLIEVDASHPGATAVLIGTADFAGGLAENLNAYDTAPDAVLAKAGEVNLAEWFRGREAETRECFEEGDWPLGGGVWPEHIQPVNRLMTAGDILTGKPLDEMVMVLLPTANPWEVNAYLQYGGWNECPMPEVHCAVAKRWWDECGAYIASVNDSVVEYRVLRPIRDREQALAVATEQFLYCTDIVSQGTGTVEALAKALLDSSVWYFWWD